jgi:predicted glycosyltransferase
VNSNYPLTRLSKPTLFLIFISFEQGTDVAPLRKTLSDVLCDNGVTSNCKESSTKQLLKLTVRTNGEAAVSNQHLRFLMYSHDGVGLGHLRRNLAIAESLSSLAPESSVLLASGTTPVGQFAAHGKIDFLKLPELRKVENQAYGARRLGIPHKDILSLRSHILKSTIESFEPDVVLVDKHPLGAGRELESALNGFKVEGGLAVLGLRDILDSRETVHHEWFDTDLVSRVPEIYDRIFVYGQQEVFDPIAEYRFPPSIADKVHYCGYVVNRGTFGLASDSGFARIIREPREKPLVLATVGGGEDGFEILDTFIKAAKGAAWQGAVVAGPMMPMEQMQHLQKSAAQGGVFFEPFVAGLEGFLGCFDALVCMGGYNTLLEAATAGVPTLCVPRKTPRREQEIRAQTFQRLGLLRAVSPADLYPANVRGEVDVMLQNAPKELQQTRQMLDISGAHQAATELLRIALHGKDRREGVFVEEGEHAATWADHAN